MALSYNGGACCGFDRNYTSLRGGPRGSAADMPSGGQAINMCNSPTFT